MVDRHIGFDGREHRRIGDVLFDAYCLKQCKGFLEQINPLDLPVFDHHMPGSLKGVGELRH